MRKNIFFVLKNIFILMFMCTIFIVALSLIIGGSKGNLINPEEIIFRNKQEEKIRVYMTKEKKIEEMPIEDYVVGVVSGEMPAEFSTEALKAQAVAARTFAVAHMEQYGGKKYNSSTGADVCDTAQCQVFMPKQERMSKWPSKSRDLYWNKINDAVNSTKGEVLTYRGELVKEPYYFAISGGKTESALAVFNSDIGYLRSVESPGEERAKKYETYKNISKKDFINSINSNYKTAKLSFLNLETAVNIKSRNDGGTVKEIKLGGITVSGIKFRSLMGLNSANFDISFNGNMVSIKCLGYGHDVGMSQWGADAMAKAGKNYEKILYHYYSGVKIGKIDKIGS
ncbi:MAG: stage II sporulation protein D [Clostridium sp.]|jgi:stage II sporulation protein D|uniref:stage II sporulation protein D n=1 Tax=Clostridium sp. TaxID=1506 RepID=UPI0025C3AA39|nr:stage II sporulation protein D [Clostridium sp.]MCH3965282.1 stage II sporulation protein D [Clostridium sp.]MCI1714503.1 stage II sporulation protein D [Clostridium sp.]MCI1798765.1 stage II sporulation protein D [Clostridium sp.]MCI1812504.1 stage II sporulation protein D [Clostridium sp.]MCI1869575.1 stage II sporulation protein D [Clostridium sp.]